MQPIKKILRLDKHRYYEMHLAVINPFIPNPLTEMEIKVLSRFMALEGDIANDRFGTSAKKIVKQSLNLSAAGLSNYIGEGKGSLIEKEAILKKANGDFEIWPLLYPEKEEQTYQFKLINIG